ncbi:MAG: hypothetical protein ACUVQ5_03205, partial [Candidatus Methanomethylicaceae archaeon]
ITDKIHAKLKSLAVDKNAYLEGLGNILLLLSLSNEAIVSQAVNIINALDIKGGTDLENRLG